MVNVGTKIEETHHLKVYSAVRKVPNGECWRPKLKKHLCLCRQGEKTLGNYKVCRLQGKKTLTQIYSTVT